MSENQTAAEDIARQKFNDDTIRIVKNRGYAYAPISRAMLENDSLSLAARGLLGYLLCKPESWEVRISDIQRTSGMGRDAIRALLRELIEAGYFYRKLTSAGRGKMAWLMQVFESPDDNPHFRTPTANNQKNISDGFSGDVKNSKIISAGVIGDDKPADILKNHVTNNKKEKSIKKKKEPKPRAERPRDFIFDGFVEACGYDTAFLAAHRGELNRNVAILRGWYKNLVSDEKLYGILQVFSEWFYLGKKGEWRKSAGVSVTPTVIVKEWQSFAAYLGLPKPKTQNVKREEQVA